jgi:rubredoxin-NAD+ reductase
MFHSAASYLCNACGWVYDPAQGDPDAGILPGASWEELPDDWVCPVCGAAKDDFERIEAAEPGPAGSDRPAGRPHLVIVGSGLAGYGVAKELRRRDGDTPILVVTADGGEVYSKPMLSNALARHHSPADLVQKSAAAQADGLQLEVRTRTRVVAIDRTQRRVVLQDSAGSASLEYDRLVLALGADPRVLPVPGADSVEIATVNDLDGYRGWRNRIGSRGRILLVGAGLIGCEFANDLAGAGFDVALVDPAPWPLARLLPEAIGRILAESLVGIGCSPHLGRVVSRYSVSESEFLAELDDGTQIPFDHALSAVGLSPRTRLAVDAGLEVGSGIRVDRLLRTSDPSIFALGDCAETEAGLLPYIAPLLAEARALAATLTGAETPLRLPAMPVVVKTPALPLVVCPPLRGTEGGWDVELGEGEAAAIYYTPSGTEAGFALAGARTRLHQELAKRMPDLLGDGPETPSLASP